MNFFFKIALLFCLVALFSGQLAMARKGGKDGKGGKGGHSHSSEERGSVCRSANLGSACVARRNTAGVCAVNVETRYINGILVSTKNEYFCNTTATTPATTAASTAATTLAVSG